MKAKKSSIVVSSIMLSLSSLASAELTWNGFLSAGGGLADPDEGDTLAGYEDTATFRQDSVLGLQVSSELSDKVTATAQILASGADNFDLKVTWANVKYQFNDELSLKLGRYQTPLYLYSDYLDVGYAYHWISPPSEVYLGVGSTQDGFDLTYQKSFGDFYFTGQLYYGTFDEDLDLDGTTLSTKNRKRGGFSANLNYDWLTFRAGVQSAETSVDGFTDISLAPAYDSLGTLIAALRDPATVALAGESVLETADILEFQEGDFVYSSLAVKAELGGFLIVSEYTDLAVDDAPTAEQESWYVSGAYTFGDWTVHLTHSETEKTAPDLTSDIPILSFDLAVMVGTIDAFTSANAIDQETNTIGVRWDFAPGVAFKAEFSDIDADDTPTQSGNLLRFAVDAVF